MNKKTMKKSLAGFMVVAVLSGTLASAAMVFAGDEKMAGNDLEFRKLKTEQLEKVGQLKDFDSEGKMKTFSADESLKKMADMKQPEKQNFVEGEVLVKFKEQKINLEQSAGRTKAMQFAVSKNLDKKEDIRKSNISVLKIKDTKTVEEKIAELKNDSRVEYVQPNFQYYPLTVNSNLWGLHNTGQEVNGVSGTDDKDIDAPEAWVISEGEGSNIIVAVIDSGVAYNHPDLAGNMWDGDGCSGLDKNGNSIGGGCQHGYDYEDNDKFPLDNDGHGTHIAGTIGAVKNGSGIIGVAPNVKIMALKVVLTTDQILMAIDFAESNNAKVINASWGGTSEDVALSNAINSFPGLFIAAAGNGDEYGDPNIGDNHDESGINLYPCDYDLDNIICVAATDSDDNLADFSDYGVTSVDVGAPGVNIYSTVNETTNFYEDFLSVVSPDIGSKFTQFEDETWGTINVSDLLYPPIYGNAIFSDYQNFLLGEDYQNDIESYLLSDFINLSGRKNIHLKFDYICDVEESWDNLYLFAYDGSDVELIDSFTGMDIGTADYVLLDKYAVDNFSFSFVWQTDPINVGGPYLGCIIDNFEVVTYSDGSDEKYEFYNGTSMAAPHVAGLAALIWGYDSSLTYDEVKNVILTTGDSLDSLDGKTVTGKRINAQKALLSLVPATHTISGTIKYYDGVKVIPNATVILENDIGEQIAIATTDTNGYYEFAGLENGEDYVVRILKDDSFSSTGVSVSDLIAIKKHTLGTELTDIYKKIAADFNSSLSITVSDLIMLKKFTLGMVEGRPTSSWKFYSSSVILTTSNYLTEGLTRTYTNLIADTPDQDFIGVKMGDVNNSWSSS